ncbi:putative NUDIX family NTP pyrophosphohydrolase [Pseudaminobacter salicylatoxidans]|uniref:Putative NUDIX family NTP pyrophosphohydrolase n=1 Tax=Pseudaminobacter salicylatoxidans TaxID=93369 RepID=A0A316CKB0_PSESE|nr:NUDIX hydrolase [Pseudaminobacter salicylatoxidans]PWJ79438.1 putative NUDIX family NTP pyrophosphohydrolase [Pseudaminobacter salicylatoxidans]
MLFSHSTRNRLAEQVRRLFGGMPSRVQVAALPWRERAGQIEIMLITSRDTGRWVLPKGWPEGREELFESAAREAAEEAGISGVMSRVSEGSYFYGKVLSSGMARRCEVRVFPMEVRETAADWPESHERRREWFSAARAATLVREPDLGEIIADFGQRRHKNAA